MSTEYKEQLQSEGEPNEDDETKQDSGDEHNQFSRWSATVESYCKEMIELVAVNSVSQTGAAAVAKLVCDSFSEYLPLAPRLPTTMYSMIKIAHQGDPAHVHSPTELQVICPKKECCVIELDDVLTKTCPVCNESLYYEDGKPKKEMLVTDARDRIKRFYAQQSLARALKYPINRTKDEGDIWDGKLLCNLTEGEMLSAAYLVMTCDASVFKKGKSVSYTPVVASWANLPPWLRFSRAGVLFLGLLPEKVALISRFVEFNSVL